MPLATAEEGSGSVCFVAIQSHAADNSLRRTSPLHRPHPEEPANGGRLDGWLQAGPPPVLRDARLRALLRTGSGGGAAAEQCDLLQRALELAHEVGLLPGEAAVLFRGAAEVAVGRRAAVDRPVQLQRAADVGRRQPEDLRQHLGELALVDLAGAV